MIKEFIGTGKTIEEATLKAKAGLEAPLTADVKIEVVQMPKKKVLGLFGGSDAQVRASYNDGKKPQGNKKKASAQKKQADKKPANKPAAQVKKQPSAPKPQKPEDMITEKDIDLNYACDYLKTMINGLNVSDAEISAKVVDGTVEMEVSCDDYGIIIGRRGETLDSLQYLTSLAIKNKTSKYVRVALNVGDYRARREETLRALAEKNAAFVSRTGRRYTFEPMNPYERRIIHTAVSEIDGVVSLSVGSGLDRRVVLEPEGGVRRREGRRQQGSRQRSSSAPQVKADPSREKKVDRADMPKFGKIEVNKD